MYIFSRTVVETLKLLCLSVACSAIFSMMIFQEDVAPIAFVCFVLNLVSLLLFLILYYKNCEKVFSLAFTPGEYWIPIFISYGIYFLISTTTYIIASFPQVFSSISSNDAFVDNIRTFFKYTFQHSRFLEPMLNKQYAFVSFIIAQVLMLCAIIYAPQAMRRKM